MRKASKKLQARPTRTKVQRNPKPAPCPVCHEEPWIIKEPDGFWYVGCDVACNVESEWDKLKYRAIEKWNAGKGVLRLFVWSDFDRAFSPGLAFAIATSKEEAKLAVVQEFGEDVLYWGPVKELPLDKVAAFATGGA